MSIAKSLKNWTVFVSVLLFSVSVLAKGPQAPGVVAYADLPLEAQHTLRLIEKGGPFPYAKDATVFRNYEGLLPKQKRGYYREYTVKTPGQRGRGARRIIAGGDGRYTARFVDYYYTNNHYASFKRIEDEYSGKSK